MGVVAQRYTVLAFDAEGFGFESWLVHDWSCRFLPVEFFSRHFHPVVSLVGEIKTEFYRRQTIKTRKSRVQVPQVKEPLAVEN